MKKNTFKAFAVFLGMVSFNLINAQTYNWNGSTSSDFYMASNWTSTEGAVAFDDSSFKFVRVHNVGSAPVINQVVAWQPGVFDCTGGSLTVNADFNCFFNDFLNGTVTVNSGAVFTCRNIIRVGREGQGTVEVNGTLRCNNADTWQGLFIGVLSGGNGTVNVNNGGIIDGGYQVEVGTRDNYPTGVLNINEGATSWAYWNTVIGPNGTVNVNGGTINCGQGLIVGDLYVDNAGTEGTLGAIVGALNINSGIVTVNHNDLEVPYLGIHENAKLMIDAGTLRIMRTGVDFTNDIQAHIAAGRIYPAPGKEIVVSYDGVYTTVTAQPVASSDSFAKNGFEVYPNPASDLLNIHYTGIITNIIDVVITDMFGKTVLVNKTDAVSGAINISGLSSGVYIVRVQSDSNMEAIKIIKD